MRDFNFENIIQILLEKFPEFNLSKEFEECDKENPFLIFGAFSIFLIKKIEKSKNPELEQSIRDAYKLFDEMDSTNNKNLGDLVVTGVFEDLVQNAKAIDLARKLFSKKTLIDFESVMKYTGIER